MMEELRDFIREEILPITAIGSDELRDSFVGDEMMTIWRRAFTHRSENPNVDHNYEFLEYQGDSVMGMLFAQYIKKRFPNINESMASELKVFYLSTRKQAEFSRALRLPDHLVGPRRFLEALRENVSIQEDLLESLFGALMQIGNLVGGFPSGVGFCYNLFRHILDQEEIDFRNTEGDAKTQLKEIVEAFGGRKDTINRMAQSVMLDVGGTDQRWQTTITLPNNVHSALSSLISEGETIPHELSIVEARTKSDAEQEAYRAALNTLSLVGISRETVHDLKRSIGNFVPQRIVDDAIVAMEDRGFSSMYFTRTDENVPFIQLIAVDLDGVHHIIHTEAKVKGRSIGRRYIALLKDFISGRLDNTHRK